MPKLSFQYEPSQAFCNKPVLASSAKYILQTAGCLWLIIQLPSHSKRTGYRVFEKRSTTWRCGYEVLGLLAKLQLQNFFIFSTRCKRMKAWRSSHFTPGNGQAHSRQDAIFGCYVEQITCFSARDKPPIAPSCSQDWPVPLEKRVIREIFGLRVATERVWKKHVDEELLNIFLFSWRFDGMPGHGLPLRGLAITLIGTPLRVGRLWMNNRPEAEFSDSVQE